MNGLKSVSSTNSLNWLDDENIDIFCLQEIKTQEEQLITGLFSSNLFQPQKYHAYFNTALKKGYSGVATYVKNKPLSVKYRLGVERFDQEGRILQLEYSDFILINLYIPHGGRQKENLDYKLEVYRYLFEHLKSINNKKIILTGDFNIAHKELDLRRPGDNQNNTMFTLKEREQIENLIQLGFVDTFRKFNKEGEHYTWWPYAVNARDRNIGWRIDYIFVSENLASSMKNAFILPKITGSDHCPIGIEI